MTRPYRIIITTALIGGMLWETLFNGNPFKALVIGNILLWFTLAHAGHR